MQRLVMWLTIMACWSLTGAAQELAVAFGTDGLTGLRHAGQELLADGVVRVRKVLLSNAWRDPNLLDDPYGGDDRTFTDGVTEPESTSLEGRTLRQRYPWGEVVIEYRPRAEALDFEIELRNTGEGSIEMVQLELLQVRLAGDEVKPAVFASEPKWARADANIGTPLIVHASFAHGRVVLTSAQPGGPLRYELAPLAPPVFAVRVTAGAPGGGEEAYDGIWNARPIAPGTRDRLVVSLRFGAPEAEVLAMCEDVTSAFAARHPFTLKWPDRRPIGAIHLGDNRTSEANPRGWRHGASTPDTWDIRTDEGYKAFHAGLMRGAEQTIRTTRLAGMQGIIVWQIEGQEFGKAAYYGEPRILRWIAPEMEGIADAYFARLREAGLRVGICIRPNIHAPLDADGKVTSWTEVQQIKARDREDPESGMVYQAPDNFYGREEAESPLERLDAKIRYAKERWQCEIFYIDTNHFWRPRDRSKEGWAWSGKMMQAEDFEELHRRHPDVLLIPEHEYLQYWSATSPYRQPPQWGGITPPLVRAVYPDAFSTLSADPNAQHVKDNRERYVEAIEDGDVFLVNGWYGGQQVADLYSDAAWRAPWRLHVEADGGLRLGRQERDAFMIEAADGVELPKEPPRMIDVVQPASLAELEEALQRLVSRGTTRERSLWITCADEVPPATLREIVDRAGQAGAIIRWASPAPR